MLTLIAFSTILLLSVNTTHATIATHNLSCPFSQKYEVVTSSVILKGSSDYQLMLVEGNNAEVFVEIIVKGNKTMMPLLKIRSSFNVDCDDKTIANINEYPKEELLISKNGELLTKFSWNISLHKIPNAKHCRVHGRVYGVNKSWDEGRENCYASGLTTRDVEGEQIDVFTRGEALTKLSMTQDSKNYNDQKWHDRLIAVVMTFITILSVYATYHFGQKNQKRDWNYRERKETIHKMFPHVSGYFELLLNRIKNFERVSCVKTNIDQINIDEVTLTLFKKQFQGLYSKTNKLFHFDVAQYNECLKKIFPRSDFIEMQIKKIKMQIEEQTDFSRHHNLTEGNIKKMYYDFLKYDFKKYELGYFDTAGNYKKYCITQPTANKLKKEFNSIKEVKNVRKQRNALQNKINFCLDKLKECINHPL